MNYELFRIFAAKSRSFVFRSMILVFGGTTEGRKAVEVLEESGHAYYYSTKTGEQEDAIVNKVLVNSIGEVSDG